MGVTYKAFDVNLCCEVALKVVSSALVENPEARERFVREARAAAALRHRNVASVYHLGNDGEHFFYAMEFIDGETLDAVVRRGGALSVENTLRVILQVARALAAAERQHLVHRDIKPANLMVTHEDADEETVVKVIDFGLARAAATAENAPPLTMGGFVGTPQYASPEQLEERPLDARSDIYSLGVTAWFLLTGRAPFAGSLATVCQGQLTRPPPWEQLPAGLPPGVRKLLAHLLEKDAARRPQNAVELRAEIEACLGEVQGTARKQDLHLPARALQAADVDRAARTGGPTPQPGTLLGARYRLLREIGGRDGVRVFQARDESAGGRLTAVKLLPEAMLLPTGGPHDPAEEVRLVQAAAHPRLVQIIALERSVPPATAFLVEEWLAGCTVRDLLAARGGALPVAETLRLLEQAASATDHAARCRLGRLDLSLTALHLTFAGLAAAAEEGLQVRALLPRSFAEWPDWSLKIHAFRPRRDPLALDTWAGGATLVPGAAPGGGQDTQALAALVYELLGGRPTVHGSDGESQGTRYASLPVLNEEANLLLRQALTGGGTCVHGWQLHAALAAASGGEPVRGITRQTAARTGAVPKPAAATPATRRIAAATSAPSHGSTVESLAFAEATAPNEESAGGESVATFFQDGNGPETRSPVDPVAGSAWDRLSLVTGKRAHPGRWLAGIIGLAVVFVLGFAGVLAWLLQQMPTHDAVAAPMAKKRTTEPGPVMNGRRSTPRPATPAPLAAGLPLSLLPTPKAERTAAAPKERPPAPTATPLAAEAAPVPPPTPVEEKFAWVRLESVPLGAQIRLGEEVLGTTPCRVRLPRGDHQLIARYQDWPETRQTIHLDGTETRAAAEIRLMRPDLVPGLAPPPDRHARRTPVPATRRVPPAEPPAPSARSTPVEPEVRPAQRVLTPFQIDGPAETSPAPAANGQPFSADDADRD